MKKKFVYLLALLTSLSCTVACLSQTKDTKKMNGEETVSRKDPAWAKLSEMWKNINKLYETQDYTIKMPLYNQVRKDYTNVDKYLAELKSKGFIDEKQKNFLKEQFENRYYSLPQRTGMVTCYEASPDTFKTSKTLDELNKQYEALDKLAQDNKINSQTYINVKENIIKDIKEYKEIQKSKAIVPDDSLIELLYFLSR